MSFFETAIYWQVVWDEDDLPALFPQDILRDYCGVVRRSKGRDFGGVEGG